MSDKNTTPARGNFSVQYMTHIAILAAISAVLMRFEIPIFGNIYKLDASNVPVMLAGFSMGPVPGIFTLLIKDLINLLFTQTLGIGDLADFIMTAAFILPASLIYKFGKSRKNALIGMIVGTVVASAVAVVVNGTILFPFYMTAFHMDLAAIAGALGCQQSGMMGILLTTTLPFNLLKWILISLLTFVIYKPLSPVLHVKH